LRLMMLTLGLAVALLLWHSAKALRALHGTDTPRAMIAIGSVTEGPTNTGYQCDPGVQALKKAGQEKGVKPTFDPTRRGDGEYGHENVGNGLQPKATYK